jgi:hypothetical protein
MRPPLRVELWTADGNPQLLNVVMSVEAAQRVYQEHVAQLRAGACPFSALQNPNVRAAA